MPYYRYVFGKNSRRKFQEIIKKYCLHSLAKFTTRRPTCYEEKLERISE